MKRIKTLALYGFVICLFLSFILAADTNININTNWNNDSFGLVNFTVQNLNTTNNITQLNITMPSGFSIDISTNATSAFADLIFANSSFISWTNSSNLLISNQSVKSFWFSTHIPSVGEYFNITVQALDDENVTSTNTANLSITRGGMDMMDSSLIDIVSPEEEITHYTTNLSVEIVNISAIDSIWWNVDGVENFTYTGSVYYSFAAGDHDIWAYANDSFGNSSVAHINFSVTVLPKIFLDWIYPLTNLTVTRNNWFNITFNVSCTDGNCGNINVSLDPQQTAYLDPNGIIHSGTAISDFAFINDSVRSPDTEGFNSNRVQGNVDGYYNSYNLTNLDLADKTASLIEVWAYCNKSGSTGFQGWNVSLSTDGGLTYTSSTGLNCPAEDYGWTNVNFSGTYTQTQINNLILKTTLDTDGISISYLEVLYAKITYGADKGLVNTTEGATPFYTNETNPRNISLDVNESELVTFWVNATGNAGTYEFFAYAESLDELGVLNISSSNYILINDTQPETANVTVVKYLANSTVNCSTTVTFTINVTNNYDYNLTNIIVNDTGPLGTGLSYSPAHSIPLESYFVGSQYLAWVINVTAGSTSQIFVNFTTGGMNDTYTNHINVTNSSGEELASTESNYTLLEGCNSEGMPGGLTVNLTSPSDGETLSSAPFIFNYTVTGATPLNCSLLGNFTGVWAINQTRTNITDLLGLNFTINTLADDVYFWNVNCTTGMDSSLATSNKTFLVDTTSPTVHLVYPANETNTPNATQSFDWNMSDNLQLNNITFFVWNSTGNLVYSDNHSVTGTTNESATSLYLYFEYNFTYSDIYSWNVYGCDNATHCSWSDEGNYTINYTQPETANVTVVKYLANSTVNCSTIITFTINVTNNYDYNLTNILVNDTGIGTNIFFSAGQSTPTELAFVGGYVAWRINVTTNTTSQIFVNFTTGATNGNYTNYVNVTNSSGEELTSTESNYTIQGDCGGGEMGELTVNLTSPSAGEALSSAPFIFNYSVTGSGMVSNCSLWGNFTGVWTLNQTNISASLGNNSFTINNLTVGAYSWNVDCLNGESAEFWATSNKTFSVSTSVANNAPDVVLDSLAWQGIPSIYVNLSGELILFVAEEVIIKGTANDTDLANWTIRLENSSGVVNSSLCFNTSVVGGDFCSWNTSIYCSGECTNYTLILNSTDAAGNFNSTIMENITIDNTPPSISDITSSTFAGTPSTWVGDTNISDSYLAEVDGLIFDENNSLIFESDHLCNKSESNCLQPGSGGFNFTWNWESFFINGTRVPVIQGELFLDYLNDQIVIVPGCLDAAGNGNYDCGGECTDQTVCVNYRWYLIYNMTITSENRTFLGLTNNQLCPQEGCSTNNTIIQNGISKFKAQADTLNFSNGEWSYENVTEFILYNVTNESNLNLSFVTPTSGNYSLTFRAYDYWWASISSITESLSLGDLGGDLTSILDDFTDGGFVTGIVTLAGEANGTGFANWTISIQNLTTVLNSSLCFGNEPVNGTFCSWNTTAYCSGECTNYTVNLTVTGLSGITNPVWHSNVIVDNHAPDIEFLLINTSYSSEVLSRANITEEYVHEVRAYIFNNTNKTLMEWGRFCGENQADNCQTILQGTFNKTWGKNIYSLNNSALSVSNKFGFTDLSGEATVLVPGCFAQDGTNYDCGGTCTTNSNCTNYRWWLIYNDSQVDNKTLLGLVNDQQCLSGCQVNRSAIVNATSRFKIQEDIFNFTSGTWDYENLTTIILYNTSEGNNQNVTSSSVTDGNFSFVFEAEDSVGWISLTALSFNISATPEMGIESNLTLLNSGEINVGDTIMFSFNVTNIGQTNITNLTISDDYDAVDFNYSSASLEADVVNYTTTTAYWNISLNLSAGESYLLYINFTAISSVPSATNNVDITAYDVSENNLHDAISLSFTINENTAPILEFVDAQTVGNATYLSQENIWANVSATDTDGISIIEIYLYNSSNELVNSSIISVGSSIGYTFANFSSLSNGVYYLNATANDSHGVFGYSETRTITLDTVAPTLSVYSPENQTYNTDQILINFTAENYQSLWYYNQTTNRSYSAPETLTLNDGNYSFVFYTNDSAGNLNSSSVNFTVDASAPLFSNPTVSPSSPANYSVDQIYYFNITLDATESNVWYMWENTNYTDTVKFGNTYVFNKTSQSVGTYNYQWYTNDSSGNFNQTAVYSYIINKSTPSITASLNGADDNLVITYPQQINLTGITNAGTLAVYLNDTEITAGQNYSLAAGYYKFDFNVTGNENYTDVSRTLYATVDKASQNAALSINETSPIIYTASINVTCNGDLFRNDSNVTTEIFAATLLGAGTYNYSCRLYESQNYSSSENNSIFVVNQATGNISLLLNDTDGNISLVYDGLVNASASTLYGNLTLYRDGSNVTAENNINISLAAGYYNYTAYSSGNQNYSSAEITRFANISKKTPTASLTNNTLLVRNYDATSTTINYSESNSGDSDVVYKIYRNSVDKGSLDVVSSAGNFSYILNTTGGQNYSAVSILDSENLTINQDNSSCSILFNESSPVVYGSSFTVGSNCTSNFTLYRNSTTITNNSVQNLAAGIYNFSVSRTDTENYSNIYDSQLFQINRSTPSGSITGTALIIYRTVGDATGTETNTNDFDCEYNLYRNSTLVSNPDAVVLGAGVYNYVYNTSGCTNYSANSSLDTFELVVNQNDEKTYILFNTTNSITFPTVFLVYSNATSAFTIYRNGTAMNNNSIQALAAETYNFSVSRTDTENYSDTVDNQLFQINKSVGNVSCYLNNSRSNLTLDIGDYGNFIWLNATLVNGESTIYLYKNATEINSGISPIFNYTLFNATGLYNLTAVYPATQNYTSSSETFWVNTTDLTKPLITISSPSNTSYFVGQLIKVNFSASDLSGVSSLWYDNSTTNVSFDSESYINLTAGNYTFVFYANDSYNNLVNLTISFTVEELAANQFILNDTSVTIDEATTEIILPQNQSLTTISIPLNRSETETITLNLGQRIDSNGNMSFGEENVSMNREGVVNYSLEIPSDVVISGGSNWNGELILPTIKLTTGLSAPSISGYTTTLEKIITVGSSVELNFSSPVKLVIGGMAGKKAAWSRDSVFTQISVYCDDEFSPTNINSSARECYTNDSTNTDLIIWTYHFTDFAAYSSVATVVNTPVEDGPGGGSSGGGGGAASFWTNTFSVNNSDFINGFTKNLAAKERVKIKIGTEDHYVGVISLTSSTAKINVSSTPQQATFSVGEIKKFEVNNDKYYDLSVQLNSIANNKSSLTIKSIHEIIKEEINQNPESSPSQTENNLDNEPTATAKNYFWLIIILIIVVIIIAVFFIYKFFTKKKNYK